MTKESVSNHLLELRARLLKFIILFGVFVIIGIPFAAEIYSFVAAPLISLLPDGSSMIATEVASPFMAPIKLVIYVALLFSMPWLFYQTWMFISPGLYKNEKKFTAPLMLSTVILMIVFMIFGLKKSSIIPSRSQSILESTYEFIANMIGDNIGQEGLKYFSFIFTLFLFILLGNLLGMFPYSFTWTSHIIVTFAIAFVIFLGVTLIAIFKHGLRKFLGF